MASFSLLADGRSFSFKPSGSASLWSWFSHKPYRDSAQFPITSQAPLLSFISDSFLPYFVSNLPGESASCQQTKSAVSPTPAQNQKLETLPKDQWNRMYYFRWARSSHRWGTERLGPRTSSLFYPHSVFSPWLIS